MSKNDSGPAFPVHDPFNLEPANVDEMKALASGMSLRDYFAAKAMQALIRNAGYDMSARKDVAEHAYGFADDMLAARNA